MLYAAGLRYLDGTRSSTRPIIRRSSRGPESRPIRPAGQLRGSSRTTRFVRLDKTCPVGPALLRKSSLFRKALTCSESRVAGHIPDEGCGLARELFDRIDEVVARKRRADYLQWNRAIRHFLGREHFRIGSRIRVQTVPLLIARR